MNLLQMKQKMIDLAVSDRYMAECCGVGERYLKQCLAMSKPMTKVLARKIEGVFHNIEVKKAKVKRLAEKEESMVVTTPLYNDMRGITFTDGLDLDKINKDDAIEKAPDNEDRSFYKGQINGLNRARQIVRSNISNQALVHRAAIDILLSLDDELESVVEKVLERK